MAFPVKHYTSNMGGAPALGDTAAGDFIALLKACLVTGFNVTPVASMTYDAGPGVVTVEVGTGHGFQPWQVIEISGADQAVYNGQHRVTATTETSFAFVPATAPSTTPATGTLIEAKAAPVGGWTIEAEDADNHKIAFSRTAPDATDHVMLVENTGDTTAAGNWARVHICESFTDLATYDAVATQYWPASHRYATDEWLLAADGHLLFWVPRYAAPNRRSVFVWGDIETVRPGDATHCIIIGCHRDSSDPWNDGSGEYYYSDFADLGSSSYRQIARAYHQLPGAVGWEMRGIDGAMGTTLTYPSPQTNGFYIATGKLLVRESSGLRGFMPGVLQPLHTAGIYHHAVLDNLPGLEGVPVLLSLATRSKSSDTGEGMVAWRLDQWREEVGA